MAKTYTLYLFKESLNRLHLPDIQGKSCMTEVSEELDAQMARAFHSGELPFQQEGGRCCQAACTFIYLTLSAEIIRRVF